MNKLITWELENLRVHFQKHQKGSEKSIFISIDEVQKGKTKRLLIPTKFGEDALQSFANRPKILGLITPYQNTYSQDEIGDKFMEFLAERWDDFEALEWIIEVPVSTLPESNKLEEAITSFMDFKDMAEQFIKKQPVYYDSAKLWWLWDFDLNCWQMVDETDLLNEIDALIPRSVNTGKTNTKAEILEHVKRVARMSAPKEPPKTWVQFKDIIVDISTKAKITPTPAYMMTNPLPWELGESTETPHIDVLFNQWVEPEFVPTLYEILAYCTLPDYPMHRIFCLTGSGSNGKGRFLALLRKFIGDRNVTASDLDTLIPRHFERAKLFKKLACCMGETNWSTLRQTSLLKQLTGQDLIGIEFKNKNPFDFINYAKIIISTNTLPMTEDRTKGFYRRWLILDFPNTFNEKTDILATIPQEEYNNLAAKCIEILNKLMVERVFTGEGTIEERMEKYEKVSNPLSKFIDTYCEVDSFGNIPSADFNQSFTEYLQSEGRRIMKPKEITIALSTEGYDKRVVGHKRDDGTPTTYQAIMGIKWNMDWKPTFSSKDKKEQPKKEIPPEPEEKELHRHIRQAIINHVSEYELQRSELVDNVVNYTQATIDEVREIVDHMESKGELIRRGTNYGKGKV